VKLQYRLITALLFAGILVLHAAKNNRAARPDFDLPRELYLEAKPSTAPQAIRMVNWNIHHGSSLEAIASELAKQPADICLFQEVDWNAARSSQSDVAAQLARRFQLKMAYGIEFEELSQERGRPAYIGQATLSRYQIRRSRVLRFARQSSFWKPHFWMPSHIPLMQRRIGSRIALVTDLDVEGKTLVVYNAHLESRSMGLIQMAQLNEMLADLKTYPPGTAAIIGGDLNSKYFPSIFLHKLQREGFSSALGEKVKRTQAIAMALDWMFVRGPFEWSEGTVRRNVEGSDHFPIYGTLNVK